MIALDSLILFISTSILLAIAPGPDNVYVLTQSALYNWRIGLFITLGLCAGLIVHSLAVVFGLSALILASPLAFNVIKLIGVAYLVYLAWQSFRARALSLAAQNTLALSYAQFYRRGIIMNLANPKIALFFIAFLPQFVDMTGDDVTAQLLLLSGLFIVIAFLIMTSIALISSYLSPWLTESPSVQKAMHLLTGLALLALAFHLALLAI